ncbi:hypothetical protein DFH06DRAFT_259457 [Mycena polygramma]|nr:hypothetical protein DFH06DRAFT_259457 [Mycena polygramma]
MHCRLPNIALFSHFLLRHRRRGGPLDASTACDSRQSATNQHSSSRRALVLYAMHVSGSSSMSAPAVLVKLCRLSATSCLTPTRHTPNDLPVRRRFIASSYSACPPCCLCAPFYPPFEFLSVAAQTILASRAPVYDFRFPRRPFPSSVLHPRPPFPVPRARLQPPHAPGRLRCGQFVTGATSPPLHMSVLRGSAYRFASHSASYARSPRRPGCP